MSMITKLVERLKESVNNTELYTECRLACYGEYNKLLREAADVIEELSAKLQSANMERSIQYYNGGWIPVSYRLPEPGEYVEGVAKYYLVQNKYGDMLVARYTHSGHWEQIYQLEPIEDEIVAWMPLPEPYKVESEVRNEA